MTRSATSESTSTASPTGRASLSATSGVSPIACAPSCSTASCLPKKSSASTSPGTPSAPSISSSSVAKRTRPAAIGSPTSSDALDELVARLEEPVPVTLRHPRTGDPDRIELDRTKAAYAIRLLSYSQETASLVPLLLASAARGDLAPLAAQFLMTTGQVGETMSDAMGLSVVCTEDYPLLQRGATDAHEPGHLPRSRPDGEPRARLPLVASRRGTSRLPRASALRRARAAPLGRGRPGDAAGEREGGGEASPEQPQRGRARSGTRRDPPRLHPRARGDARRDRAASRRSTPSAFPLSSRSRSS